MTTRQANERKNDVERAFRNSRAVTLGDSKLYLIIEANHINETVMLDEVYQDGQSYVSKKLPRIGARFDMLRKPTLYRWPQ